LQKNKIFFTFPKNFLKDLKLKLFLHHLDHPPIYFIGTTFVGIGFRVASNGVPGFPNWFDFIALTLCCIGLCLGAVSVFFFLRWHTGIIPFSPTTHIVQNGFYRFTRNPMYLGLMSLQLSCFLGFGNPYSLLMTPVFWAILHYRFVLREEQLLLEKFGGEYEQFLRKTRRWL